MYDEFQFDANYDQLPDNLPRDGWQTKDWDCALSIFRVLKDGRVLRAGSKLTNDADAFYFSDRLTGYYCLYTDKNEITLVINNGFVAELLTGECITDMEVDLNWQPFFPEH
ncbi:MAG TPA: hypothetical protein ENI05_14155 [Porticoccus sp.]|nr:hypothetical protein [Porticoccus sp.]